MMETIEGYLFWTSGCEHGPTIMIAESWDQSAYEQAKDDSWCDNEFLYRSDENGDYLDGFAVLELNLEPGTKYRLTIEELKESQNEKG
ncbi:MAG: hypothetical protein OEY10_05415 [Nitrosopumilus sp.]|nr:hypothetical protein [Nitrosopumilus sp.]